MPIKTSHNSVHIFDRQFARCGGGDDGNDEPSTLITDSASGETTWGCERPLVRLTIAGGVPGTPEGDRELDDTTGGPRYRSLLASVEEPFDELVVCTRSGARCGCLNVVLDGAGPRVVRLLWPNTSDESAVRKFVLKLCHNAEGPWVGAAPLLEAGGVDPAGRVKSISGTDVSKASGSPRCLPMSIMIAMIALEALLNNADNEAVSFATPSERPTVPYPETTSNITPKTVKPL